MRRSHRWGPRVSRRRLLKGLGAAAASLPFLHRLPARADGTVRPKLIVFATDTGTLFFDDNRLPGRLQGDNKPEGPARADDLPDFLKPLEKHLDRVIFMNKVKGLDSLPEHGMATFILTGQEVYQKITDDDRHADGPSVDHVVAQRFGLSPNDVLGMSYDLERSSVTNVAESRISFTAPGRVYNPELTPLKAWQRVFGDGSSDAEAEARLALRRSILDVGRGDVARWERSLPPADRQNVSRTLQVVKDLESRLGKSLCKNAGSFSVSGDEAKNGGRLPQTMREYSKVMVAALACGWTRVGFLQTGNLEGDYRPVWPEFNIPGVRRSDGGVLDGHGLSHAWNNFSGKDKIGAGADGVSHNDVEQVVMNWQRALVQLYAELLDELEQTPDPDVPGTSLLDNTIVLHVKQMGSNHNKNDLFWMLAGGQNLDVGGGKPVRGGRFMNFYEQRYCNDVLLAVCHAMGLHDMRRFGKEYIDEVWRHHSDENIRGRRAMERKPLTNVDNPIQLG